MRHLARLEESFDKCLTTGKELILIARYLLRHMDVLDKLTVVGVHGYLLRVVDIVDDKISVGSGNHSDIITHACGTRLHVGKYAVCQDE